jgi:hypothetical protein
MQSIAHPIATIPTDTTVIPIIAVVESPFPSSVGSGVVAGVFSEARSGTPEMIAIGC